MGEPWRFPGERSAFWIRVRNGRQFSGDTSQWARGRRVDGKVRSNNRRGPGVNKNRRKGGRAWRPPGLFFRGIVSWPTRWSLCAPAAVTLPRRRRAPICIRIPRPRGKKAEREKKERRPRALPASDVSQFPARHPARGNRNPGRVEPFERNGAPRAIERGECDSRKLKPVRFKTSFRRLFLADCEMSG